MTNGTRALLAAAFLALSVPAAADAAVTASLAAGAPVPPMSLISTDTHESLPFATIEVGQNVFTVTVGDQLYGVSITSISPNHVTLSDRRNLYASAIAQNH
jgi:hypothetical protein